MSQGIFKPLPVVILAGGLATRLRPMTETIPKALIDINNDTFISHQLRLLKSKGIEQVTLCLGYLGEQVIDYLKQQNNFDLDIQFSFDGPKLLGTAGAIKQALKNNAIANDQFFVMYGDSYLNCDYLAIQQYFVTKNKQGLMTVFKNSNQWDKSNIEYENNKIIVYDKKNSTNKMHYIDYGLSIFYRTAFDLVPNDQPYDLAELLQLLLSKDEVAAYEVKERFYEAGSFSGIDDLKQLL
jgi:NDP-sugar pyrophosphorylase family protein